jgi:hypothetical protein
MEKILIITLVFEKYANFFAQNCRKSQKIVIITSTRVRPVLKKIELRRSTRFELGRSVVETFFTSCANELT